ncbi:hypothetical protein HAX54_039913, partial [Datura stramonium]|nr:hypothetical protein [Datura stramonium]
MGWGMEEFVSRPVRSRVLLGRDVDFRSVDEATLSINSRVLPQAKPSYFSLSLLQVELSKEYSGKSSGSPGHPLDPGEGLLDLLIPFNMRDDDLILRAPLSLFSPNPPRAPWWTWDKEAISPPHFPDPQQPMLDAAPAHEVLGNPPSAWRGHLYRVRSKGLNGLK